MKLFTQKERDLLNRIQEMKADYRASPSPAKKKALVKAMDEFHAAHADAVNALQKLKAGA
jgi:hypothetical protein